MDKDNAIVPLAMPVFLVKDGNMVTVVAFVYRPGGYKAEYFVAENGNLILNNFQVTMVGVKK